MREESVLGRQRDREGERRECVRETERQGGLEGGRRECVRETERQGG